MSINLSTGEWKLMSQLWDHPSQTITELTAALRLETGWSKNTVITMLSRLEAKGAVLYVEDGRAKRYAPLVPRAEAARKEAESFLDKVFGGSLGRLVNSMVQSRGLTQADIDELQKMLDDAKEKLL